MMRARMGAEGEARAWIARAAALLGAVALACSLAFAAPAAAWGEDGAEDEGSGAAAANASASSDAGTSDDAGASSDANAQEPVSPDNLVNPQQRPDSSFIYDASISDLEKADSYLDGQTVQVTGEVVGDRINAEMDPDHCWLVLEAIDGSHAEVSVYVPKSATDAIDTYGAYGKRGTVVQARGTFNLTCGQHEGLSDLHVNSLTVVSKGVENPTAFELVKFVPGLVLVIAGLAMMLAFSRMRESRR